MKRLSTIFFAGLLCFSLGYIAHDIVGEAGVKFAGSAMAFPITPIAAPLPARIGIGSHPRDVIKINHNDNEYIETCEMISKLSYKFIDQLSHINYFGMDKELRKPISAASRALTHADDVCRQETHKRANGKYWEND